MFQAWQAALLLEQPVARLATIGPDGAPHLVPVCFALYEGTIVIAIDEKPKREGRLARETNIERDPRATLLVDRYEADWSRLAWVRVDCTGSIAAQGREHLGALAALRERYAQYRVMDLESRPLIVLEPIRVRGWRWTE